MTATSAVPWNPSTPCFPAILDTGHTHNFAIQNQPLIRWGGIQPEKLRLLGHIRHDGKKLPLHALKLWLHLNQPGSTTVSSTTPIFLNVPAGIAAYPDGDDYPRLPLLGLRAILSNDLYLSINGKRRSVTLRTPD